MRRRLIPMAMALVALALIALFLDTSVFVIKDVRIVGESGMDDLEVIRAAGVEMGGKMRKFEPGAISRNVGKTGMLKCVNVETEMPSTIVITVERRKGRVVTDYGGSIVLMDGDGYVMSISRELPEGDNLYVTGLSPNDAAPGRRIGAHAERVDAICAVLDAMDRADCAEYISELNVEKVDSLYLYSRTGIQVMLGDAKELESKLVWMKYALKDLEARGKTSGKLDVTSGNQADYMAD